MTQDAQIIGAESIKRAETMLEKYKQGKISLDQRIIESEKWYRLRHWETFTGDKTRKHPGSAWLFNAIANKHADAMDNYPEPNILPRAADDKMAADALSDIVPVVLERNDYEQVYSDAWWQKLKSGTSVKGIFWNPRKLNGLGDIEIQLIDPLNLFWEPGITDIQDSPNLFHLSLVDYREVNALFPDANIQGGGYMGQVNQYQYDDNVDTTDKVVVVDWYYKRINESGKTILHFCKYTGDTILFASENMDAYTETGWYNHGLYPFVFDVLFPVVGSPCGFGQIDINKDTQEQIDKMNQAIVENTIVTSKKRRIVNLSSLNIKPEDLTDITKDVIPATGSIDESNFRELTSDPLPSICVNVLLNKIEEIKETSGNRDFSQGGTSSGVTAASAIAALMEAGSKLSRDMIKGAYRAFTQECYIVIELIRQFYDAPRKFRITGKETAFVEFDNSMLKAQEIQAFGQVTTYEPVFDIQVVPQKKSPFSKVSQNELAKEFFAMGFFNPQLADQALACIDMMDFDGKDQIIANIQQNGTMYQTIIMMQQQMAKMAAIIDSQNGTDILANMGGNMQQAPTGQPSSAPAQQESETTADKAKTRARKAAEPE